MKAAGDEMKNRRSTHILLFILLSLLLFLSSTALDDDDDLSFLESDDENDAVAAKESAFSDDEDDDDGFYEDEDFENYDDFDVPSGEEDDVKVFIDDKDVVVLTERNLTDFVENNRYVMVEFYAPWCGHCKELAPEYAAAATELKEKGEEVVLAKVDADKERELAGEYDVKGFPTLFFFVDGEHVPYPGQRTKDAIVTWIKKTTGPGVYNITTTEDAEGVLTSANKVVLAFLESLVGPASEELAAASKLDYDVNFYQTANPNVAKLFHMDSDAKRPTLVMLKREEEKLNLFDGPFVRADIAQFVSANKLPLVTTFSKESAPTIFESPIKKQLLLFAASSDSEKVIPTFQEAAKSFKGKLIFVYIQVDNEEVGKPVAEFFGVTGNSPKVIGYLSNDSAKKFIFEGDVTLDKLKVFAENFTQDELKPFYKSDPIPESNDGDVKVVVGNNFDEIVLDESKDVLLEVYAPWCGHCQALEPTYNKLAKHLRGIESLVIAKMDGTTNEHPSAKADGFPTLLFFPAGKKNPDPIIVDSDRTVVALYKFLKKHSSIPFKLQTPATTPSSDANVATKETPESSTNDVKDEL